jgi:hypothetical protein
MDIPDPYETFVNPTMISEAGIGVTKLTYAYGYASLDHTPALLHELTVVVLKNVPAFEAL